MDTNLTNDAPKMLFNDPWQFSLQMPSGAGASKRGNFME